MILRVSFLAAAAAVAVVAVKKRPCPKHPNPEKNSTSLQDVSEEGKMFTDNILVEEMQEEATKIEKGYGVTELSDTDKNAVEELEYRKLKIENRLYELCNLKEQQSSISRLRRNLEEKVEEIGKLKLTVESLKEETNDLRKEFREGVLAAMQLEKAKKVVEKMQRTIDAGTNNIKGQLMMLQQQVSSILGDEACDTDFAVERKLKGLELKVFQMKRKNKELELEKRELAVKLVFAQARITTLSNLTEREIIAKIEGEISNLRRANKELSKQVERLEKNRFAMVDEFVYQRWLNKCLKFEVQNHKTLSEKKRRSSFNLDSIFSPTSSTESSSSSSSSIMSSSSSQRSSSNKKTRFIHHFKKRGRSKDDLSAMAPPAATRNGLIRRFSTSMVPSKPSMLSIETANEIPSRKEKLPCPRERRVSFADSVTADDSPSLVCRAESLDRQEHELSSPPTLQTTNTNNENVGSSVGVNKEELNCGDKKDDKLECRSVSADTQELQFRTFIGQTSEIKVDNLTVHLTIVFWIFAMLMLVYFLSRIH